MSLKNFDKIKIYFNRNHKAGFDFQLNELIENNTRCITFQKNNDLQYLIRVGINKLSKTKRFTKFLRLKYEKDIFIYEKELWEVPNFSIIFGSYINYRYVDNVFTSLNKEINIWFSKVVLPTSLQDKIQNSLVLHIRRGDVANGRAALIRGNLTSNYYKKALEIIYKKSNAPFENIIAITDDLIAAQMEFATLPINHWYGPDDLDAIQALKLFSISKNFIGANSTLSWWGARLAVEMPKRNSILPTPWLGFLPSKADEALFIPNVSFIKSE